MLSHFSCVRLFLPSGTIARQAPLSMGFSRQEYWSGLPCPPPGDLPDSGIEPASPAVQVGSLPAEPLWKPLNISVVQGKHTGRCWEQRIWPVSHMSDKATSCWMRLQPEIHGKEWRINIFSVFRFLLEVWIQRGISFLFSFAFQFSSFLSYL